MRYFLTFILLLNIFAAPKLLAASAAETKAFNVAKKLLELKQFKLAEESFAQFGEEFPESTHRPEAILHQAQARFHETNFASAIELLQTQLPQAGAMAHEYHYWIAQSFSRNEHHRAAADSFAALIKNFPESPYILEACYSQALAESKLDNESRVIELLQSPDGSFQTAAKTQPNNRFVVDGNLLLAETLLRQSRFDEGQKVIAQLDGRSLTPDAKWRQYSVLSRLQLAAGEAEAALQSTTNLVTAAQESGNRRMFAETILLRGEILEKLNRLPEAIEVHEQNFAEGTPSKFRRQSFFKAVDLVLALGQTTNAIERLEKFIEQNPRDASLDLARLTLGELRLKQFVSLIAQTNSPASSNLFEQALTNFNFVIANFPQGAHVGRAHLNRGWCFWLQENIAAAEADFLAATERLPVSEDKAVARFKLADAQFRQTNYAGAVTNYGLLIQNYAALERITNSLFEPALYQSIRASLKIGNTDAATDAMHKLLDWFPNGSFSERSLLLVGENLDRAGKPAEARSLFLDYLQRVPDSPRLAEINLAVAQTHVQEKNWPLAFAYFDEWVTNFSGHPLLPQGEFSRALACEKAGQETNAFNLFTNFVVRFPTNPLAALAQNWVADFYWNHKDFRNAEKAYQELYQKFNPSPELGYGARLMAGRAAYDRANYSEAANYFKELITLLDLDTNAPASTIAEVWFALGDTTFEDFLSNTNESSVREAITAFSRITKDFSTNALAPLAWGRIGDCYFQWAGQDEGQAQTRYERAMECYGSVIVATNADVSARSRAEVGVGNICVKRAAGKPEEDKKKWMDAALRSYTKVVTKGNLKPGETFDAKWMYEAGIAAAKICEGSEQWEQAMKIYEELIKQIPPLRPAMEKKVAQTRKHLETVKN